MKLPLISSCPGTLAPGYDSYSRTCLNRVFAGRKVDHILPYDSPSENDEREAVFQMNQRRASISGVQEKFSLIQVGNKLRLSEEGEQGTHILKPIPGIGRKRDQIPANEHLTMQIARQIFNIETAENALIFFQNGELAYITRRFDVKPDGTKWGQEDFASLAGRTASSHGDQYKYLGNYLDLFHLLKSYLPAHRIESLKLYRLLLFNYLFSNGDAHIKNFSILETPEGDHRLAPAYDLLNTSMHIDDEDFALVDGLLPPSIRQGPVSHQFRRLALEADIPSQLSDNMLIDMLSHQSRIEQLVNASYLSEKSRRQYWQTYKTRHRKLSR